MRRIYTAVNIHLFKQATLRAQMELSENIIKLIANQD
jgi:hypothetical protein